MKEHHTNNQAGFSLVEITLVLIIAGLTSSVLFTMFSNIGKFGQISDEKRLYDISYALSEHLRVKGSLPCPAKIDLPISAPDFAKANCAGALSVAGKNGGTVLIGALPIENLVIVSNCAADDDTDKVLDADEEGLLYNSLAYLKNKLFIKHHASEVAAGSTEQNAYQDYHKAVKEGCMSKHFVFDDYGRKFIYAVSERATDVKKFNQFDKTATQIEISNANGNRATQDLQFFTIIGLGENGKGGINRNGVSTPCDGSAIEQENCDNDSTFIDTSYTEGNNYFDDILEYSSANLNLTEDTNWTWSRKNSTSEKDIVFNPNARIFIDKVEGTDNATDRDKLVVNSGNILVEGNIDLDSTSNASGVYAPKFCYEPALSNACK